MVTDVAFLPEKGRGPELLGAHETALFSVAVDSRCQLHLLPSRRESSGWAGYIPCHGYIPLWRDIGGALGPHHFPHFQGVSPCGCCCCFVLASL